MSTFSYSSRAVFLHFGNTFLVADLPRVRRLEGIGGGSLCMIYSTTPGLGLVLWTTGELNEDEAQIAGPAIRILAQRDRVLSELAPEARQRISRERASVEASGVIDAEFAQASAPAV